MQDRTKQAIIDAFNDLIRTNDIDRIKVSDICKAAKVSRTTFYRYFLDKYDVMNHNYEDLYSSCITEPIVLEDIICNVLKKTRENYQYLTRMFESYGVNSFYQFVWSFTKRTTIRIFNEKNLRELTREEYLQLDILMAGLAHIGENWVSGKYEMSSEEATKVILSMMPPSLVELLQ